MTTKRTFRALLALAVAGILAACGNMATPADRDSIAEIAAGNENLTTLVTALTEANLVDTFAADDGGPFTVFAPTNAAFEALPDGVLDGLLADPDALAAVLTYHVAAGALLFNDVAARSSITTLNGIAVNQSGGVLDGYSNVISGDIVASNGVIHLIDSVLLPKDIVDVAITDGRFTTLVAALQQADLVDTLRSDGPFTVFAPTDAAFEVLLADLDISAADLLASPDLADILLYHVTSGALLVDDVLALDSIPTANGIAINQSGGVLDGYSNVIITDIVATNGVVHVIDAVLQPKDIVDVAITDGRFTTLVAAVAQEGLVDTLRSDGPFTVFAPTDDAFAAALVALDLTAAELLALPNLTDILLYHVVSGSALDAAAVVASAPGTVGTVEGSDISYAVVDGGVVLNDTVNVIITDILATNGIIHAIDFVLLPPTP
jgi:transforming growth factor-beta-induced protein